MRKETKEMTAQTNNATEKMQERLYNLYIFDWMANHNYTIKDMLDTMQDNLTEQAIDGTLDTDMSHTIGDLYSDFVYEQGFNGSSEIYCTLDEFMDAEYKDSGYIERLCSNVHDGDKLLALYKEDMGEE
jgi:hypothetical protein